MIRLLRKLARYRPGRLGQNTLFGAAGLGIRSIIQAIYLLLVSRWLGAEGYGLFAGSVALVVLGTPLANWGSAMLLTRYISEDRSRSRAMWATALVQTGVVGGLLVVATLLASTLLFQQLSLLPMLLLALSELILLPAAHAATSQCYALERGKASATVMCLVPLGRTLAMLLAIVGGLAGTPGHAAMAHFIGSVLGLLIAMAVVAVIDGLPAWRSRLPLRHSFRQGTAYAVSNLAGTSYQEVDKVLMLQVLGAMAAGTYTVAFRAASIFVLPISALISATLPRLMAHRGSGTTAGTFRAVLLVALGYGLIAGMAIVIAAPFMPVLFGPEYEASARQLLLFSPWPVLFALRQCFAAQLTARLRQVARTYVEIAGLVLVVVLNWIFLPLLGVKAAALALLTSEIFVSAAMWMLAVRRGSTGGRKEGSFDP